MYVWRIDLRDPSFFISLDWIKGYTSHEFVESGGVCRDGYTRAHKRARPRM